MAVGEIKTSVHRSGEYVEVKVSQQWRDQMSVMYRMATPLSACGQVYVEKVFSEPTGTYTEAQEGLGAVPWEFLAAGIEALMQFIRDQRSGA